MYGQMADSLLYMERFELVRFFGAGGAGGIVFGALFLGLSFFGANHRITALAASAGSFMVSFTLYRIWTFPDAQLADALVQLSLYGLKKLVFFTANYFLLRYFVERRGMRQVRAQIVIGALGAAPSYLIVRWIFVP